MSVSLLLLTQAQMMMTLWTTAATFVLLPAAVTADWNETLSFRAECLGGLQVFDEFIHKEVYTVGVHAAGGIEVALMEFNWTFEDYLTATAGQRFDPPIKFQMEATELPLNSWIHTKNDIDFFYSDTGIYSCVGVEIGAEPIATTIKQFNLRGKEQNLDMFAGK